MLSDATYRTWTKPFNAGGSYFEGDWQAGSKMLFLGPDPVTGELGGLSSIVRENTPYEFISVQHMGFIADGEEDTTSDLALAWGEMFENYTFQEKDGGTDLLVDLDSDESNEAMFNETWPLALQKLKELCEA